MLADTQPNSMDRSSSSTDASDGRAPSTLFTTSRSSAAKSPVRKCADLVVWFLLDQWFLVILGILIIIASQVQVPRSQQAKKQLVIDYLAVSVIFFINGCTLPTRILIENLSRWQTHLFVQVQSYLMASAVTFGIVSAAATSKTFMDPGLLIGMLILSCLPTTYVSYVMGFTDFRRKADVSQHCFQCQNDQEISWQRGPYRRTIHHRQFSRPLYITSSYQHVYIS